MRRAVGGLDMHGSDDPQAGLWTLPSRVQTPATGGEQSRLQEIAARRKWLGASCADERRARMADQLPGWTDGQPRTAILGFVRSVTERVLRLCRHRSGRGVRQ